MRPRKSVLLPFSFLCPSFSPIPPLYRMVNFVCARTARKRLSDRRMIPDLMQQINPSSIPASSQWLRCWREERDPTLICDASNSLLTCVTPMIAWGMKSQQVTVTFNLSVFSMSSSSSSKSLVDLIKRWRRRGMGVQKARFQSCQMRILFCFHWWHVVLSTKTQRGCS